MKTSFVKKLFAWAGGIVMLLIAVLCVHIYIVTRPHPVNDRIVAMARIDFKQNIDQNDAQKITAWLYGQNGVEKVLCNPEGHLVVFSYHPTKTNADQIVNNFKSSLDYQAERFVPSAADLKSSCPAMASNPVAYKIASFFKHII